MATTKTLASQDTRSESDKFMSGVEQEHFGRCFWQLKSPNGRMLVEMLDYPKANRTVIVVKHYDGAIRDGRPWPKMEACYVYLPVDDSHTWDGLENSLKLVEAKT